MVTEISTLLMNTVLATVKNMPPDVDLMKVRGEPFYVSKNMLTKEISQEKNLYLIRKFREKEKEYFLYQEI